MSMLTLTGIKVPVAVLALAVCCSFSLLAQAAGPRVRTASHEAIERDAPDESPQDDATSNDNSENNNSNRGNSNDLNANGGTTDPDTLSYSPRWPEPPNTGAMLMRLGFGTVAVLVLCVVSLRFGKPWLQRLQIGGVASGSPMVVQGSVALGNRAMLYLVKVGDTQLIAGTDAAGLKSLIAIPASFKDVLDDQIPPIEVVDVPPSGEFEAKV